RESDLLRGRAELLERELAVAPAADGLSETRRACGNPVGRERAGVGRQHRHGGEARHRSHGTATADGAVHRAPFFISPTACAAARAVSAMYVIDGFWHPFDAMHAPSVTNRFFTSHAWFHPFSTPSIGVMLMRAPPISWMQWPGGLFEPCV